MKQKLSRQFFLLVYSLIFYFSSLLFAQASYNSQTCIEQVKALLDSYESLFGHLDPKNLNEKKIDAFEIQRTQSAYSHLKKFFYLIDEGEGISSYELLRLANNKEALKSFLELTGNSWYRSLILAPTVRDARRLNSLVEKENIHTELAYLVVDTARYHDLVPVIYLNAGDSMYINKLLNEVIVDAKLVSFIDGEEKIIHLSPATSSLNFEHAIADKVEYQGSMKTTLLEKTLLKEKRVVLRSATGFFTSGQIDIFSKKRDELKKLKSENRFSVRQIVFVRHIEEAYYLEELFQKNASMMKSAYIIMDMHHLTVFKNLFQKNLKTNGNLKHARVSFLERKLRSFIGEFIYFENLHPRVISAEELYAQLGFSGFEFFFSIDEDSLPLYSSSLKDFLKSGQYMYMRNIDGFIFQEQDPKRSK